MKVEIPKKKKIRKKSSIEEDKYASYSDSKPSPYLKKNIKETVTNKNNELVDTKRVLHRWESQCKPFMQYQISVNTDKTIDELQIAEKMKVIALMHIENISILVS